MPNNALSKKLQGLLKLRGYTYEDMQGWLSMTSTASLRNKLSRGAYSADDLIKFAAGSGGKLKLVYDDTEVDIGLECLHITKG